MGEIFGGGARQQAPAPAVAAAPVAPSGPQLAPGQQYPGGPAGPYETAEQRKRRLAMVVQNTILADDGGGTWGGDAGNSVDSGADGGSGSAAP